MHDADTLMSVVRKSPDLVSVYDFDGVEHDLDDADLSVLVTAVRRALADIASGSPTPSSPEREHAVVADLSRRAVRDDVGDVLGFAVEAAVTILGARTSSITVRDAASGALSIAAYAGPPPRPSAPEPGPRSGQGFALGAGTVVVCPDSAHESRFTTEPTASGEDFSAVFVPVIGDGDLWGVLTITGSAPRVYDSREISFLESVADIASAAIHRSELESQLRHRSMHDPLTGLPNRELVNSHLGHVLAESESVGRRIAVLLVDFDNFKSINDHFGHEIGDITLISVAERLRDAVTATGHSTRTVFRLGGDEFLVVLDDLTNPDVASDVARDIVDALRVPLIVDGRSVPLSASIGIALSENGVELRQLVHRADVAMYRAKSQLPGNFAVYDADDDRQARHHLTMSTDLRAAVDNDELTLTYVPIVDTATGTTACFAAIPRWEHPALGTLDADDFVATAERTGLMEPLGQWVLGAACRDAAHWLAADPRLAVRVEVAPTQICHESFVRTVLSAVRSAFMTTDQLILSVPESALDLGDERIGIALSSLHSHGIRLFLDNSSGGHSSIRNLTRFPYFEYFQVDDSDVAATFREHASIVLQSVVGLIHSVGTKVVAGGIESAEQLRGAAEAGCEFALGDYFGSPLTASEAAESVRRTTG